MPHFKGAIVTFMEEEEMVGAKNATSFRIFIALVVARPFVVEPRLISILHCTAYDISTYITYCSVYLHTVPQSV